MKLGVQVGLGPGHIVLDWDPALPPPKVQNPQFSAHICCSQMAGWIKMPLSIEVDLGPGNKKGRSPQFSAHVYCGQTAGCIEMPLGMEVGLSPDDFVLDGDPAPLSSKGAEPPNFRRISVAAK